jgi:uncharacterized protein
MRLIVLDTNVIVSARLSPAGAPASIVIDRVLPGRVRAITCPSIIAEYFEVVRRPKFARFRFPPPWLDGLIEASMQLPDPPPWPHQLPDPADEPFLALTKASGAWLVTGNLKHFPERARNGVTVVSPGEYLAQLTKQC